MSVTSENSPLPRLCVVKKTYPEQEYGFNLHGEKGKKAQYIGSVDPGSPADLASLQPGDKILAVNGSSILHDDHKHVVAKIREDPMQCKLLVVEDESTASLFKVIPKTVEKPLDQAKVSLKNDEHSHSSKSLSSDSTSKQYRPRLCQLNKTLSHDEYGFNLHAESSKGYFIGKVDQNSIADIAGLVEGQRIVGVNKTLIYPSSAHKEVVSLIKQNPVSVLLLVASADVDEYYLKNCIDFNFDDAEIVQNHDELNVHAISNGATVERTLQKKDDADAHQIVNAVQHLTLTSDNLTNGIHLTNTTTPERLTKNVANGKANGQTNHYQVGDESNDIQTKRNDKSSSPEENPIDRRKNVRDLSSHDYSNDVHRPEQNRSGPTSTNGEDDLFKLSAAQMRERVTKKKKSDARHENNLSLMEKYEIIKNL